MYGSAVRFDGELMHLIAGYNYTPEVYRALRESFPMRPSPRMMSGRAILSRDVLQVEDTLDDPDYPKDVGQAGGFRSMLAAPMLRDGRPIGAIVVNRAQPGLLSPTQIQLLRTFADQAVIAIENTRLFEEVQACTRELQESLEYRTATSGVLDVISRSPDELQPVLDTIVQTAQRLCQSDRAQFFRLDDGKYQLAAYRTNPEFQNYLAENAISPEPGSGSTTGKAGRFAVAVTDTGPGIPTEDRLEIFEEFRQVDSSNTKKKGGTGLGLAMAKQIIEMHGGRIWVESSLGKGSTFRMELPVRAAAAPKDVQ
jgi:hypothetical protein